jgi:O-antigen/teichoic acid export membrane protein
MPLTRLVILAPYALISNVPSLTGWLWLYATSTLLYVAMLWWRQRLCASPISIRLPLSDGIPFAVNMLSARLQAEFNKPVLAHVGFESAGTFSAAQRAIDIVGLPLGALQEALWPRLYGEKQPARMLRHVGGLLLATAAACGVALWAASPMLPRLLGRDFEPAISTLRMLAWLPLLQVFRALVNFHVIHSGRTALIGWAAVVGAAVNVLLVAYFVPRQGALGAIIASYASEAALITVLLIASSRMRTA